MLIKLLLMGSAVALWFLGASVRKHESSRLLSALGWLLSGAAYWTAVLIVDVWAPFWPVFLLALASLLLSADLRQKTPVVFGLDAVLLLALGWFSTPRPPLPTWALLVIVIPFAGLVADLFVAWLRRHLSPAWPSAVLVAGGLLLLVVPPFADTTRRLVADRLVPSLLQLPFLAQTTTAFTSSAPVPGDLAFTDITAEAGTGGPTGDGETGGHGVMWADTDDDTLPDLYITMNWEQPMAELYFHNLGNGRFADEGAARGIDDFDGGSHGACFADVDNDGDYDLYNGTTTGIDTTNAVNELFRNEDGRFTNVTAESGLPGDVANPTRAVLCFDMDGDGDLDLFAVTNYQGSNDPADEQNELYRNEGNGRFTPVTTGALLTAPAGQGAIDTDYDGDGDIDVIAANRTGPVNILQNDGAGNFTLIDPEAIGITHPAGDGITTADVNNDGHLDLLLAGDGYGHLYLNDGDGTFSPAQSFSETEGYMGGFADLDHDGDLDLIFPGDSHVYLNMGGFQAGSLGEFALGPTMPVADIDDPRAVAFADIENDGDLDFAIGAKRSRNWLLRNHYDGGNWLKVRLVSPQGQAGAFGAKLFVYEDLDRPETLLGMREARSNYGYLAQDDPVLHVGLGAATAVDLLVRFPDGTEISRRDVVVGQTVFIDAQTCCEDTRRKPDLIGTQWAPYLEWSITDATYTGNPFDVQATATFTHTESGETRTTGLFYAGSDEWRFRFTGTQPGEWTFITDSVDPDLDGYSGRVMIQPNPGTAGFVTHYGNKWGRTGIDRAFVPQYVMIGNPQTYYNNPSEIRYNIETFLQGHGFNGVHTPVFCRWFDIEQQKCSSINVTDPNPDPRTFAALEDLITEVHAAGGVVHIWMWGDDSRGENPKRWGINGTADRRLQRYIAARLGPLPGWTMGYGYDLFEWVRGDELTVWHNFMHAQMGWDHYLGARSHKNQLDQLSEAMDYASYEQHRPDYETYVESIELRPEKPTFSEDRFRIRDEGREKDYTMALTRRGLWHSTMAGGVANIWGNLIGAPKANDSLTTSAPYPNPEMIKTYATFFADRFWADMVRCNELTNGTCLMRQSQPDYVFYAEETAVVEMDLSQMAGAQTAVAVDTRLPYAEIDLGTLSPDTHTWEAPYASDWAVAVGDFAAKEDVSVRRTLSPGYYNRCGTPY